MITNDIIKKEIVSSQQAAEILDRKLSTILKYTREGRITPVLGQHGSAFYFKREDIEAFKDNLPEQGNPNFKTDLNRKPQHELLDAIKNDPDIEIQDFSKQAMSLRVLIRLGIVTADMAENVIGSMKNGKLKYRRFFYNIRIVRDEPIKEAR